MSNISYKTTEELILYPSCNVSDILYFKVARLNLWFLNFTTIVIKVKITAADMFWLCYYIYHYDYPSQRSNLPNIQTSLAEVNLLKLIDSGAIHLIGSFPLEAREKQFMGDNQSVNFRWCLDRLLATLLTLSVPVVLLNSPNLSSYFSLSKFERIVFLIFSSLLCLINS